VLEAAAGHADAARRLFERGGEWQPEKKCHRTVQPRGSIRALMRLLLNVAQGPGRKLCFPMRLAKRVRLTLRLGLRRVVPACLAHMLPIEAQTTIV